MGMPSPAPIPLYRWILSQFTLGARAEFVELLAPHFTGRIKPGDRVLDLCCGAGPFSFRFEQMGAQVTGIDNAPFMIELARKEAEHRGSKVDFILADVLTYPLPSRRYDLIAFLGNTLSDFSLETGRRLMRRVKRSLAPGGRFAIHYLDGVFPFAVEGYPHEAVEQEEPVRITRRFKQYDLEAGAYTETYRNEATGEETDYTSFLYTVPMVRLGLCASLRLDESIPLSRQSVLEFYR
jgi:SAM-dependent methyltransferase